jgi:hypothetical protein
VDGASVYFDANHNVICGACSKPIVAADSKAEHLIHAKHSPSATTTPANRHRTWPQQHYGVAQPSLAGKQSAKKKSGAAMTGANDGQWEGDDYGFLHASSDVPGHPFL